MLAKQVKVFGMLTYQDYKSEGPALCSKSSYFHYLSYCNGEKHFRVKTPVGSYCETHQITWESRGCDKQSCAGAKDARRAEEQLPSALLREMGCIGLLDYGCVLVHFFEIEHNGRKYRAFRTYRHYDLLVTPQMLAAGTVIPARGSLEVLSAFDAESGGEFQPSRIRDHRLDNVNGCISHYDVTAERRRDFAYEQRAYLESLGFSGLLSKEIMQAAGPGQVRASVDLFRKMKAGLDGIEGDSFVLGTLQYGLEHVLDVLGGRDRKTATWRDVKAARAALRDCNLIEPDRSSKTPYEFFSILAGVYAIANCGGLPKQAVSR